MNDSINTTPLTPAEQIVARINELQAALAANAPNYQGLLHTIHQALIKDQEAVHLLTEEQIGVICAGLTKNKNVVIATAVAKSKTPSKKLAGIGLDDL
jgi:hypothetical protein